ncbi:MULTISPECIES: hypothetical protein [Protofrankia]|uniref:Uncharacterized protein n=2 Tax=Protofrankia TaxID=2994361 RepID=F8B246_9ACTN|nr:MULTISPECIES: hypothetical protein [Protofrankia]AEH08923.1 hypothetical protein FsymDg_1456 [Candidatus Protofrankia datiscae]KLL11221.1 hypothetical protein FrCorBMG51_12375 [Protofrankia coriariae]ONH33756.1 hypothetical protein BL254_19370 [Protofrankia sp. BMG5.30]
MARDKRDTARREEAERENRGVRTCPHCRGTGRKEVPRLERDRDGHFDGAEVTDCAWCGGGGALTS